VAHAAVLADTLSEPVKLRFSPVVGENTPKGQGALLFKKLAEERLAGRVEVEFFPDSQRFTDEQVLIGLLFGDQLIQAAAGRWPRRSLITRPDGWNLSQIHRDRGRELATQRVDCGRVDRRRGGSIEKLSQPILRDYSTFT